MNSPHAIGDPGELAALYAAGALPEHELAAFEQHLETGCAICAAELRALDVAVETLYAAVPPTAPAAAVRAALLQRIEEPDGAHEHSSSSPTSPQIWRAWPEEGLHEALFVRRATDAAWESVGIDGIEIRRLFVDREHDRTTMLVRMAPGTAYPRHIHHGPEECFVLEGDLSVGDELLHAGDYQRAAPSSRHPVQSTTNGCLLLIVSSMSDELE